MSGEVVHDEGVHIAFEFVGGLGEEALFSTGPEGGSFFEGEAVGGEVLGLEVEGFVKGCLPVGEGLMGDAEDEIEGDVEVVFAEE